MQRFAIFALGLLLAASAAPCAFGWGAYHGGYGGASYHGAYGGGAYHSGAFGTTGVHSGAYGTTAYHSGAYGTTAYHSGAYGTTAYHGGSYGGTAYGYHGGYYGGYYGHYPCCHGYYGYWPYGLALGVGLGWAFAAPWYYDGYYYGYYPYGYGPYGYGYAPPPSAGYPGNAAPPACGSWIWHPETQSYAWAPCAAPATAAPPAPTNYVAPQSS